MVHSHQIVALWHGIRLCDSLEFVTENSGKLAQIKHANFITDHSLTDYFDKRTVSIFFFNLCHDNDCHLPTWLLKECKAELVPLITDIVNMSLRESMIPKSLKTALIRSLLKKNGLDSDILKNDCPVSNLTFISKVIKKWYQGGSMNI